MDLSRSQRETLIKKIESVVAEKYYAASFNSAVWHNIVARYRNSILEAPSTAVFEERIAEMLAELSPNTLGLLSEHSRITPRNAINASFSIQDIDGGLRWVFQDVLPGGVAAKAGIQPGDILLRQDEASISPQNANASAPAFEMKDTISLALQRGDGHLTVSLKTGDPKYKDNPYSDLKAITATLLDDGVAYLKVSLFQGKVGIDFAKELDELFSGRFADAKRLIIDLRGNPGGGIGGLALMSYLAPSPLPVGYSKNRKMALKEIHPSTLPVFDRVPRSRLAIPALALKFMGKTSVFLKTDSSRGKAFRGQTVVLVNEHSTGASEMLAQFAQENRLATIVGTKTPGRLVSRTASKLGLGYRLVVPVAAYVSAKGTQIEGTGISPDVSVPWSFSDAVNGRDNQLAAAIQEVQREIPTRNA